MIRVYKVRNGDAVLFSTCFSDVVNFVKKTLFSDDYQEGYFRLDFEVKKFSLKDFK